MGVHAVSGATCAAVEGTRRPAGSRRALAAPSTAPGFPIRSTLVVPPRRRRQQYGQQAAGQRLAATSAVHAPVQSMFQVASAASSVPPFALAAVALAVIAVAIKTVLDRPSRAYEDGSTVAREYDAWTDEGVLEHYWGEHIHLGHYSAEERSKGAGTLLGNFVKDFKQAKFDFVDEMMKWSGATDPKRVLDCGCGIGGTTRHLAKKFPGAELTGITLSPSQVRRATELAAERGISNTEFKVMNALAMDFPDNTFDLVWACESGEHMPDKRAYVKEMVRVLKPGGTLAIATWCQREETASTPFSEEEKEQLKFLYEEWAHPYFISKEEYGRIAADEGMDNVVAEDWVDTTLPSWRHSIWVGVWSPWAVIFRGPRIWYKTVREIVTLERMHRAFARGLMEYGMIKSVKKATTATTATAASASDAAPEATVP